jgi:hypothetical protein
LALDVLALRRLLWRCNARASEESVGDGEGDGNALSKDLEGAEVTASAAGECVSVRGLLVKVWTAVPPKREVAALTPPLNEAIRPLAMEWLSSLLATVDGVAG